MATPQMYIGRCRGCDRVYYVVSRIGRDEFHADDKKDFKRILGRGDRLVECTRAEWDEKYCDEMFGPPMPKGCDLCERKKRKKPAEPSLQLEFI